jgi:hypothetical protein
MALTPAHKSKLSGILDIPYDVLRRHLLAVIIDPAVEADILRQLDLYEPYEDDFLEITPTASNSGVKINAEKNRAAIRKRLRTWLYIDIIEWTVGGYGTGGQSFIERG